jgi:hypothetical protein
VSATAATTNAKRPIRIAIRIAAMNPPHGNGRLGGGCPGSGGSGSIAPRFVHSLIGLSTSVTNATITGVSAAVPTTPPPTTLDVKIAATTDAMLAIARVASQFGRRSWYPPVLKDIHSSCGPCSLRLRLQRLSGKSGPGCSPTCSSAQALEAAGLRE